jgi:hypothetical protein
MQWSVWASGIGFCDQLNGAIARVLAGRYRDVQLISVTSPEHTYGRVWSEEKKDWMYFDAWPNGFALFRLGSDGRVVVMQASLPDARPAIDSILRLDYSHAPGGFVLNEYAPTILQQLWLKLRKSRGWGPRASARTAVPVLQSGTSQRTLDVAPSLGRPDAERVRALLDARFALLFGNRDAARRVFSALVVSDEGDSTAVNRIARWYTVKRP